jgi:hypothetical protein
MWLLLLATCAALEPARATEPPPGPNARIAPPAAPVTIEEKPAGERLWGEAERAFAAGELAAAEKALDALIRDHATHPRAVDARHLRGLVKLARTRPAEAVGDLRAYVEARGRTPQGLAARLALGRAYLESGRAHEALLASEEVLRSRRPAPENAARIRAVALKTRALLALDRVDRAEAAVRSAASDLRRFAREDAALTGELRRLEFEVKLRRCESAGAAARLTEAQARTEAERRATCLQESLPLFRAVLEGASPSAAGEAAEALGRAFASHRQFCETPPTPPEPRTAAQLAAYRSELGQALMTLHRAARDRTLELFHTWKASFGGEMVQALELATKRVSP